MFFFYSEKIQFNSTSTLYIEQISRRTCGLQYEYSKNFNQWLANSHLTASTEKDCQQCKMRINLFVKGGHLESDGNKNKKKM